MKVPIWNHSGRFVRAPHNSKKLDLIRYTAIDSWHVEPWRGARAWRAPDEARAGRALVMSSWKALSEIRARALCAPRLSRAWRALIITAGYPEARQPWCEGIVMQCVSWCLRATYRVFQDRQGALIMTARHPGDRQLSGLLPWRECSVRQCVL